MTSTRFTVVRNGEDARALLKAHGITPTRPRVEIARVLFARPQHVSADQIAGALTEAGVVVSKATVYNTLWLFVEKGLVRELLVDPERSYYDSNMSPHHHLYDIETACLEDIPCGSVALTSFPAFPPGVQVEGVDIFVRIRRT